MHELVLPFGCEQAKILQAKIATFRGVQIGHKIELGYLSSLGDPSEFNDEDFARWERHLEGQSRAAETLQVLGLTKGWAASGLVVAKHGEIRANQDRKRIGFYTPKPDFKSWPILTIGNQAFNSWLTIFGVSIGHHLVERPVGVNISDLSGEIIRGSVRLAIVPTQEYLDCKTAS